MKEIYTQHTLNEFFEEFKKLPISYKIEQVHQLLNNPNAKATHKVNSHFINFKFISMTSIIIVSLTAVLITLSNHEQPLNKEDENQKTTILNQDNSVSSESFKKVVPNNAIHIKHLNHNNNRKQLMEGSTDSIENRDDNKTEKTSILEDLNDKAMQNPGWTKDTILDGRTLFVTLTQDELLKLGIKKLDEGIYYCNVYKKHSCNYTRNPDLMKKNFKLDTTHFSFYPIFECDVNFEKHPANSFAIDYNKMDTLLPVVLKYGSPENPYIEEISWFTTNKELFEALPERYKYLESIYTELKKLKKNNITIVNYFDLNKRAQKIQSISTLQLTDEQLVNLGYEIIHDTVSLATIKSEQDDSEKEKPNRQSPLNSYSFGEEFSDDLLVERKIFKLLINVNDPFYYRYFYKFEIKNGLYSYRSGSPLCPSKDSENSEIPIPILLTDTLGRYYNNRYSTEQLSKKNIDLNTLLPIKIDIEKYNFTEMVEGKMELLFWYNPDSTFISRLPKELSKELMIEYSAIINKNVKPPSSYTYFEVCRSTLQLESFKLYPNPANYAVTIEFVLAEEAEGTISIINIAGVKIKTSVPNSTFKSGHHTYQLDLSGISPGMYLISINTDKGFKTQRLIVSQ